jgi:hypothetical protein
MALSYSEISRFLEEASKTKPLTEGSFTIGPGHGAAKKGKKIYDKGKGSTNPNEKETFLNRTGPQLPPLAQKKPSTQMAGYKPQGELIEETDMRFCPKCEKMEVREECAYGPDYWDAFAIKNVSQRVKEGVVNEFVGGKPGDGYIGHPNLDIKNPFAKKQVKGPTGNQGLAGKLGDRKMRIDNMMKQLNQSVEHEGETIEEKSAAWQRSEGKNKKGGLNEKGRKSYERENPGSDLKAPQPEGGPRKRSFCARMGGMKGAMKKPNGEPTRKALALRKWKC